MRYLGLLGQLISRIFETVRGERKLTEITEARAHIESLNAYATDGYRITIHCHERKYRCEFARWYIPNFVVNNFEVFATIAGTAPQVLVDACARERSFPSLLHTWSTPARQKEAAIEAYLDLLKDRLQFAQRAS